jgi:hypothetical protein
MTVHLATIATNRQTGQWRFCCSCGFYMVGSRDEVCKWGARHDLEPPGQWEVGAALRDEAEAFASPADKMQFEDL